MQLTRLQEELADVADEAVGRGHRADPVVAGSGGPAGNARLTAWTGLVLVVLFVAELVTLLEVRRLISWHVIIGALLVPPVLLKTATTSWRILRYYTGNREYRAAGPPPMLLRLLGPLVIATTIALLGSGVLLILVGADRSRQQLFSVLGQGVDLVSVHQATFVACGVALGLHFLARILPALRIALGWAPGRPRSSSRVPGRRRRGIVLAASLALAGVTAAVLLPMASDWQNQRFEGFEHVRAHTAP